MSAQKTSGPRISVCIATFNEGPNLEATIALVYASKYPPTEVIVCDDNSEDDPRNRLASWAGRKDFTYIRNKKRMGSGATKSNAMKAATGDLIIILDSHMRPHRDWLGQIAQAHLEYPNALLCTESIGFDQPQTGQFYGRGAYFDPDKPFKHGAHTVSWNPQENIPQLRYPRIQAMHGGCYIFPSYQFERIKGYAPLLRGWGYEEEWVAMRACAYGIETRLISGCPIAHEYKRSLHRRPEVKDGKPQGWEPYFNRHIVAIAAFGMQKWTTIYRDNIINGTDPNMRPYVEQELHGAIPEAIEFRKVFSRESMACDEWMRRLNIHHPQSTGIAPDSPRGVEGSTDTPSDSDGLESNHGHAIGERFAPVQLG